MFGSRISDLDDDQPVVPKQMSLLDQFLAKVQKFDPYPVLYSRTATGATQTWKVEVEGNKYRFITGQKGSKNLITSEWTVCKGKNLGKANETSPEEQAAKKARAALQKKLKSGGYWESESDIDNVRFVEPILAKLYMDFAEEIDFSVEDWGCQTKFNGLCCLITKDGAFSRRGEKFVSIPHITNSLSPFFERYPDAVLHGELFNDTYRQQLNEIVKLCRKTTNVTSSDLEKSKQLICYYIYDGYVESAEVGESVSYKLRKKFIDTQVVQKHEYCVKVDTFPIKNTHELQKQFKLRVDRGDEGLMLRNMEMSYEHKRSRNLLKVKPEDDDEVVIIKVIEGSGNWGGTAKTATVKWKDKVFDATFIGSHEELAEVLKNKSDWENKKVTMFYFGLTGLGTPNSARIDVNNCIKGDR